jgi:hypothetical protein
MHTLYIVVTIMAALAAGYAATLSLSGADSVRATASRVRVPAGMMIPCGILLALGAAGLLVGLAEPALGTAAAAGLVAYFVCAVGAHVRVRDRGVGGAVAFLVLVAAALTTALIGAG